MTLSNTSTQNNNLAAEINDLHRSIDDHHRIAKRNLREGLSKALDLGDKLGQAKAIAGHGSYAKWVETNCEFSYRSARIYKRLADHRTLIEPKMAESATLGVDGALKLIAKPKPTPEASDDGVGGELKKYPCPTPSAGTMLMAADSLRGFNWLVFIEPGRDEGYYHLYALETEEGKPDAGAVQHASIKQVPARALGLQLHTFGCPPATLMEWHARPDTREKRQFYNPWLYESDSDYIVQMREKHQGGAA